MALPPVVSDTGSDYIAGSWPYGFGRLPPSQAGLQFGTGIGYGGRDRALQQYYQELFGPSFLSAYEAGPVSAAASQYRGTRASNLAQLAKRGLLQSGARGSAQRGLEQIYGGAVLGAGTQAAQAETQRKQSLLASILGVSTDDLSFIQALNRGALGQQQAQSNIDVANLESTKYLGTNVGQLVAMLAGGIAGGGGGLSGIGGTSGQTGALSAIQGASAFGQMGGGGGGGGGMPYNLTGFGGYQAPQYQSTIPLGAAPGVGGGDRAQQLISNLGLTLAERH